MTLKIKERVMSKRKNGLDNQPNLSVVSRDSVQVSKTEDCSERAEFTVIDHISEEDFFSYYCTMSDVVLPQLNLIGSVILSVLFHQSYGSGRNWCQILTLRAWTESRGIAQYNPHQSQFLDRGRLGLHPFRKLP